MDRRTFIQTAGALTLGTLAGCGTEQQQQTSDNTTTAEQTINHEALQNFSDNHWEFIDNEGKKVNLKTLKEWVGNNNSTLSFMFNACGSGVCPRITADLAALNKAQPSVKNIVVSVNPAEDHMGGSLVRFLNTNGLSDKNTQVIFPVGPGENQFNQLRAGLEIAPKIQHELGLITAGDDHNFHNPSVVIYGKTGKKIGRANIKEGTVLDTYNAAVQQQASALER